MKKKEIKRKSNFLSAIPYLLLALAISLIVVVAINV